MSDTKHKYSVTQDRKYDAVITQAIFAKTFKLTFQRGTLIGSTG